MEPDHILTLPASVILFLKGVYLKRTRRFSAAEKTLLQYLSLPETEDDKRYYKDYFIFALLGECYQHAGEKAKAEECFRKVTNLLPNVETL